MLIEIKFEVSEKFPDFFAALAQTVDYLDSTGARQTLRITEPAKTLPKISLLHFFFGLSKLETISSGCCCPKPSDDVLLVALGWDISKNRLLGTRILEGG